MANSPFPRRCIQQLAEYKFQPGSGKESLYWRISALSGGTATFLDRRSPANIRKNLISLQRASNKYGKAKSQVSNQNWINQKCFGTLGGEEERRKHNNKGFTQSEPGRGTGGDPAQLHAMSMHPVSFALPWAPPGRQAGRCVRVTTTTFSYAWNSYIWNKCARKAWLAPGEQPSCSTLLHHGAALPAGGSRGSPGTAPRSPRPTEGGSRDGRQPHGARSLQGRLPLRKPEAGPPGCPPRPAPRCLSLALPAGPAPYPAWCPGFWPPSLALPAAFQPAWGLPGPAPHRQEAAGTPGERLRAALGTAPSEAVSPGSRD